MGTYKILKEEIFSLFRCTLWWRKDSKLLLWLLCYLVKKRNEDTVLRTQKRSCWIRSWLQRREEKGCYHNLFKELLLEDTKSFKESVSFNLSSISSSMFSVAMFPTNSLQILSLNITNNFFKHYNKYQYSIIVFLFLQNMCCRPWATLKSFWNL